MNSNLDSKRSPHTNTVGNFIKTTYEWCKGKLHYLSWFTSWASILDILATETKIRYIWLHCTLQMKSLMTTNSWQHNFFQELNWSQGQNIQMHFKRFLSPISTYVRMWVSLADKEIFITLLQGVILSIWHFYSISD